MKVQLKVFAIARQAAGSDTVELSLSDKPTIAELREALLDKFAELQPLSRHLRFAVNSEYADDTATIEVTDELACIPPVSGG